MLGLGMSPTKLGAVLHKEYCYILLEELRFRVRIQGNSSHKSVPRVCEHLKEDNHQMKPFVARQWGGY